MTNAMNNVIIIIQEIKERDLVEVRVTPIRELFFNEDSYFGIYGCSINPEDVDRVKINGYGGISIKGVIPKLDINSEYIVTLSEDVGSKYAGSYNVESIRQKRPETIVEQRVFLETILTPNQVSNIYNVYKDEDDVVGMIEKGEFDYSQVKGIGDIMFQKLQKKILMNLDMSHVLTFLSKYGTKYNMIAKLISEYKNAEIVIQKIETNPYLLTEIRGIGFIKADEIAKAVGYDMLSSHRINSCLEYCVLQENKNGHSWISRRQLVNKAIDLLDIERKYIDDVIENNLESVINVDDKYTIESIYKAELFIAESMIKLSRNKEAIFKKEEINKFLDDYSERNNIKLEKKQRQFFHDWNENPVLVLVGGGGVGKSWLQKILLDLIKTKDLSVTLLSPTGKASKIQSKYTQRPAYTIHRRVGVRDSEDIGVRNVIESDIIIVDETSMCDVLILSKLFEALTNDNVRILFVGDDFQLPSVGVGNFLHDVLSSGVIKITRLTKVFRQDDGGMLNVATDTRENIKFMNNNAEGRKVFGKDCVFWNVDQEYIYDGIIHNYKKALKNFSEDDIIILTPTNKGKLGTIELNKKIQEIANPPSATKKEKAFGKKENERIFRVGDTVMNIVNTYNIETLNKGVADVFNGDTGKIIDIDEDEGVFTLDIDDIHIKMKFEIALTNLIHGWVISIHRAQGDQFPIVISITDKSATYQLNANLMYTAWSRAEKYLINLGQAITINRAMNKFANMSRRSFMQGLLLEFNQEKVG